MIEREREEKKVKREREKERASPENETKIISGTASPKVNRRISRVLQNSNIKIVIKN